MNELKKVDFHLIRAAVGRNLFWRLREMKGANLFANLTTCKKEAKMKKFEEIL